MSFFPDVPFNPTFHDFLQALGPDDAVTDVGELLSQTNQLYEDMTFVEGNLLTGHRFTVRTGLPSPTWRRFYQGIPPTKSTRAQLTASCGMLEDYAEVDKAQAELNGNSIRFRLQEDMAHIEGFNQRVAQALMYENEDNTPEAITGFMAHYTATPGSVGVGQQIIDGLGAGSNNASILLVGWAPNTVYGIFPKGSKAGITVRDLGEQRVYAQTVGSTVPNGYFQALTTHYRWDLGLVVQDYRYAVRICNISRSLLGPDPTVTGYTGANLPNLMFQAMEYIPSLENCRPVFYMDRSIKTALRQQMPNVVKNATLQVMDVGGKKVDSFQEIPIRRMDVMRADEARVT